MEDIQKSNPINLVEGIYYNVPEEIYFQIPAVHNSLLKTLVDQSPRHAITKFEDGSGEPSKAQQIGSQLHMALLEPERYKNAVLPYLSGDGRTKRVRQSKKIVKAHFPDAEHYVKHEVWEDHQNRVAHALDNDIGKALFSEGGHSEVTMIAKDPVTGLPLKCRWDYINFRIRVGMDYKTTRNAHPESFRWDIYKYKYYWQVPFYRYIASLLGVDLRTQLILAQEKGDPPVAVWYDLPETALALGKREFMGALQELKQYVEDDYFPAYENENKRNILVLDLPDRAYEEEALI